MDTIQNDEKSQCNVAGKDPRCHTEKFKRTKQVQTSQVGGKKDLVEAEPDLFCYERFKEWASRLQMKKISDSQIQGNQDTKKTKSNPAETLLAMQQNSKITLAKRDNFDMKAINNCHKSPPGIAQEERKNVDCYCCAIVQQNEFGGGGSDRPCRNGPLLCQLNKKGVTRRIIKSSKPCNNGPLCRLEKRGLCVFDHSSNKAILVQIWVQEVGHRQMHICALSASSIVFFG